MKTATMPEPMPESEFTYDGFDRWAQIIEKTNGIAGSTNRFVWCGGSSPCEERDGGNNVQKRFFEEGEQIAGNNYYFVRDALGSVQEMVDADGFIRAQYEYDPYGQQTQVGQGTQVAGDMAPDFGFAGYYQHAPSGLYLTVYRAYDPSSGRWLNRDPIGEDGGLNLYEYAANDPIDGIDPLGLEPYSELLGAIEAGDADTIQLILDTYGDDLTAEQAAQGRAALEKIAQQAAKKAEEEAQKKLLSECRRMTDNELKKLYGNKVHDVKDFIKSANQYGKQLKADKNFDFMLDKAGNVVLRGNQSGTLIPTGLPPSAFAP